MGSRSFVALLLLAAAAVCVSAQACTPATTDQPVVPILSYTQKVKPTDDDDTATFFATFDIKNCNPYPVPLGACLSITSALTGSNVTVVGALPAAAIPAYTRNAFTVQLAAKRDNITVTITTSAGSASASSGHGNKTCSGVACGNPLIVAPAVRLCTNPCPSVYTENSFWHFPHPLLTTNVIVPVPQLTCGARSLAGEYCVIVGASKGAGHGVAQILAAEGCTVVGTSRKPAAYPGIQPPLCPLGVDVGIQSSVDIFFDTIVSQLPKPPKIIVNAVGTATFGPMESYTAADLAEIINVNCLGHHRVVRRALQVMGPGDGYNKIILFASSAAFTPVPDTGPYAISKFCTRALGISWSAEQVQFGRYQLATNQTTLGGAPYVAPEIIMLDPGSMNTSWGLEYFKGSRINANDIRVVADRMGSRGYIEGYGINPLDVGTQVSSISSTPNALTQVEYFVYNQFNPASIDTLSQDDWNSAFFNMPVKQAIFNMFNHGLGGFGEIIYGQPQYP